MDFLNWIRGFCATSFGVGVASVVVTSAVAILCEWMARLRKNSHKPVVHTQDRKPQFWSCYDKVVVHNRVADFSLYILGKELKVGVLAYSYEAAHLAVDTIPSRTGDVISVDDQERLTLERGGLTVTALLTSKPEVEKYDIVLVCAQKLTQPQIAQLTGLSAPKEV